MSNLRVLIIGAGIGGLTLAQALRKQGIDFEIFEKDESENSRKQGWAIGIHTVLNELRSAVPESMPPLEQTSHLLPLDLPAELIHVSPDFRGRHGVRAGGDLDIIRASRRKLRDWLLTDIKVNFNKELIKIEENDGKVTVLFRDGTSHTGDVLVGADGINSVVRTHVLKVEDATRAVPVGTITGEVTLHGADVRRQLDIAYSAYIGDTTDINGNRTRLFVGLDAIDESLQSADYYWTVVWPFGDSTVALNSHDEIAAATADELYCEATAKMQKLPTALTEIIAKTGAEGIRTRQLIFRDMEINAIPSGRLTILGDAAHPMTPFRGEGGVHAIQDALCLAQHLALLNNEPERLVCDELDAYSAEMLPRGLQAVRASRKAFDSKSMVIPYAWAAPVVPLSTLPSNIPKDAFL